MDAGVLAGANTTKRIQHRTRIACLRDRRHIGGCWRASRTRNSEALQLTFANKLDNARRRQETCLHMSADEIGYNLRVTLVPHVHDFEARLARSNSIVR